MIFAELHWYGYLLALFFGLGCGSYATMPAHRLPRGEPAGGRWIGPKSKCPGCGAQLRTRDLVPVFNWLLTGGKCQFCGREISLNYLFIEASCAIVSVFLYWRFNFTETYILLMILGTSTVVLLSTDWRHHMFPRQVIYAILLAGVAYRVLQDHELFYMINSTVASLLACFAYKGFNEQRGREVARYDYLQFIGLTGIWLDEPQLVTYFAMAGLFYLIFRAIEKTARVKLAYGACVVMPLFIHLIVYIPGTIGKLLRQF